MRSSNMLRMGLATACVASLSLIASAAHASGSHTLIARAHNAAAQAISFPETTTFVQATHEQGVAGVNDHIHNHAEVNSDTGHFALSTTAVQTAPGNTIQPISWNMGAVLEENVIYSVKLDGTHSAVGLRAAFNLSAADGKVSHTTGITMTLTAKLSVDECSITATRTITYSNEGVLTSSDLASPAACTGARLEGSTLYVEVPNFGKVAPIIASIGITFNYANNFTGVIDANFVGDLKVDGIDGVPEFASPTFNSKAPGALPPANTPADAGGSNSGNGSSGSPNNGDGGLSINPVPSSGGESDDSCTVSSPGAPSSMSGFAFGLLAFALSFIRRRRISR